MGIERSVLLRLYKRRKIGSSHIRLTTVLKCGWKPHEVGKVKKAVKSLLKQGLLVYAKKTKKAIQLNKERIAEVRTKISV